MIHYYKNRTLRKEYERERGGEGENKKKGALEVIPIASTE